jgi:F-type H+-transporting ATPase subunit a
VFSTVASGIQISVGSEELFRVAGFPVTNSLLTGLVSMIVLLALFSYVVSMIKAGRYNRFVGLTQWAFEGMLGQINDIIPDKKIARMVTPLALTIFFYMMISYWMSVLPGLDSVTYNHVPVLRSIAADLNFTFAVSIIVLLTVQFHALRTHGPIGNLGRYFRNPLKDPIGAFEGLLEFIGEFSRYAALAVRMFGNCFAGEILLVIIAVLTSYFSILALPLFMVFELFIGFVQAYVFFVLTVIFTGLAVESHGSHDSPAHSPVPTKKLAEQE